ncbi:oxoglutarate-dependent flavonoid 7-O-demethylase 1-like [Lycium barbarum]|uniref:oxoglutarate-dependent flavonoid 7-O-demethylase 1-like n=1 Tax=Lycium barbarum TaxID=112863 RepID=UPI00293F1664|nr:oxoglutarate-dependent flavonoid 7-O-demethylase 1-like [Lycium barbarum]
MKNQAIEYKLHRRQLLEEDGEDEASYGVVGGRKRGGSRGGVVGERVVCGNEINDGKLEKKNSSMEEARSRKLGGSLKVPNVQELAEQQLAVVPPRYIREDIEKPVLSSSSILMPQVPVIDMEKLLEIGGDDTELERLHFACKEWGFFQLVNHRVSSLLMEKVKSEIRTFFHLPMEEKKKFEQQEGDLEGYGQAFVVSEEQKLDWADMLYMITLPINLRKPHLFPKLPVSLRDALDQYSAELKELAMKIICKMARALGMQDEDMNVLFKEEGAQMMRINYYPPCPQPDLVMGLCSHSDSVGLTILLQVNETEGLQINKGGAWIPVPCLPDAFVVNIGDILEIVTNGIYKSIEHRAVLNEDKERISIATFLSPKLDGDLGPAPSLLTPQNPAKFRRIGVEDFFKGFFSRKLVGKSYIDTMRIGNGDDESN